MSKLAGELRSEAVFWNATDLTRWHADVLVRAAAALELCEEALRECVLAVDELQESTLDKQSNEAREKARKALEAIR